MRSRAVRLDAEGRRRELVRLGYQGPYSSFGFTINPAYVPITFDYASWSENVGSANDPLEDKRQSLQLSINF